MNIIKKMITVHSCIGKIITFSLPLENPTDKKDANLIII